MNGDDCVFKLIDVRPAQVDVRDAIKRSIAALSAHGEHELVNALLDAYDPLTNLIIAARQVVAQCGHLSELQAALAGIGDKS